MEQLLRMPVSGDGGGAHLLSVCLCRVEDSRVRMVYMLPQL